MRLSAPLGVLLLFAVGPLSRPAAAQVKFMPNQPAFEFPLAYPRPYALAGQIFRVDPSDTKLPPGTQAAAILGGSLPLVAFLDHSRSYFFDFAALVTGRFDLSDPLTAFLSSDWQAAVGLRGVIGPWSASVRYRHDSSHLGDKYAQNSGQQRLDWSRETLEGWLSYTTGRWSITGNAGYALKALPAGIGRWNVSGAVGYAGRPGHIRPLVGVYAEWDSWTNWDINTNTRVGVGFPGGTGREFSLSFIAHTGYSTQYQFYSVRSNYIGGEFRFSF